MHSIFKTVLISEKQARFSQIDLLQYWLEVHKHMKLVSIEWGPHVYGGCYELVFAYPELLESMDEEG